MRLTVSVRSVNSLKAVFRSDSLWFSYFKAIREKMREMGNLSGVPIEPIEQTTLLDACVSQAGVIGGGVPGGTLF